MNNNLVVDYGNLFMIAILVLLLPQYSYFSKIRRENGIDGIELIVTFCIIVFMLALLITSIRYEHP